MIPVSKLEILSHAEIHQNQTRKHIIRKGKIDGA